jgi:hypothetical protein
MAGDAGGRRWSKWAHPVSKLIPDRERLAWLNVGKFRTPGKTRKDDPITLDAVEHGATVHLQHELDVLKPLGIVTIGTDAGLALSTLTLAPGTIRGHLKLQGASNKDVAVLRIRKMLLDAGADI